MSCMANEHNLLKHVVTEAQLGPYWLQNTLACRNDAGYTEELQAMGNETFYY